MFYNQG